MDQLNKVMLLAGLVFIFGCQSTPCRDVKSQKTNPEALSADKNLSSKATLSSESSFRVKIFKADGSLQCEMGKKIPLDEMKKQLKGITVYSSNTLNDGLMRIQVCGAPTGQAHVFEISESDLQKALKLGFKQWTAN